MQYGDPPKVIGTFNTKVDEMMFYQDMPIKMAGLHWIGSVAYEHRLECFNSLILSAMQDFYETFGKDALIDNYIYLSAKNIFQPKNCPYNRPGYHTDGFMTNDINYIWCDKYPTIFNYSHFRLTQDHTLSIKEMEEQALPGKEGTFPEYALLRLNQYNIHRVDEHQEGMRAFLKITFSKDKYDLIGNTHNYELDYNWEMRPRSSSRNVPQSTLNNIL